MRRGGGIDIMRLLCILLMLYTIRSRMDDFVLSNLHEARNEWCSRLVGIFCPLVQEGIRSIYNEACKLCEETGENEKYLMTLQNLLSRIPSWNSVIIEEECKRLIERSGCTYLEDLITCVHIIQLKVITSVRVGNKQKKIDISIPDLDTFVHKVYINTARKVYRNIYLFERNISPLQIQKNNREFELIVQECIMTTIRDSIPTEQIIRAYMDETEEQEEEVIIEEVDQKEGNGENENAQTTESDQKPENSETSEVDQKDEAPPVVPSIVDENSDPVITKLTFNDYDAVQDATTGSVQNVEAPKDIDTLEEISQSRAIQRRLEEDEEEDDKIKIHTDSISLGDLDILEIDKDNTPFSGDNLVLDDVEVLA